MSRGNASFPAGLRQSSIVWATVEDPNGISKRRPLVIVTADDEIATASEVVGVFVTTRFSNPHAKDEVLLPWQAPNPHPATRLARPSVAKCSYLRVLKPESIEQIKGYVPGKTFVQILARIAELDQ